MLLQVSITIILSTITWISIIKIIIIIHVKHNFSKLNVYYVLNHIFKTEMYLILYIL